MATYTELRDLFSNDALKNKLDVAITKAAAAQLSGTPSAEQQKWAAAALANPRAEAGKAFRYVLAVNSDLSVAQIEGATDAAIQAAVDAVVPALVVAFNAV